MKHKKERMYMAYMIQQHPQQISTESLAHQKRKSVADKSSRCEASSFFLPSFCIPLNGFNKINGGICFRHHDHNTGRCDRSSNNVWRGGKRYQDTYHTHLWCEVRCHPSPSKQKRRMITKVRYSKNPGKTIDYILNPKKRAHVVIARGVSGLTDISILTEDFNHQYALHPSLKMKAVHIPISFHVNDTAMLEVHAEEIIGDWIRHMERHGYRFDQFIVGRHHDKDDKNPHFHFLANVVLDEGTRANLANIGKAAKEASISVTEQWGLTPANHRKRIQTGDKKDTNKNESRTAEIHNHRYQNYIEWDSNPASNEDSNSDSTASNDRESATSSISGNLMEGITELIIQPTVARIGTGSGSSDNTLDRDKNKNKQRKGGYRR